MSERAQALDAAVADVWHGYRQGDEDAFRAAMARLADVAREAPADGVSPQPDEATQAHGYLSRLLVHAAPQCEPFPDLLGLCTQIDNLLTGYRSPAFVSPVEPTPPAARMRDSPRPPLTREALMTDTLTDTPTDTTAQRAELVAYYEGRRAQAERHATHAHVEADEMGVMGRTVRVLSDAAVADEYQRLVVRR